MTAAKGGKWRERRGEEGTAEGRGEQRGAEGKGIVEDQRFSCFFVLAASFSPFGKTKANVPIARMICIY